MLHIFIELILEAQEPTRKQALSCLERTLTDQQEHFGQELWREIFS